MAVDGKWNIGWNPGRGSRAATIELAVSGSTLSGTFGSGGGNNDQPIQDGVVDGEALRWSVTQSDFSGPFTMRFEAKVDGDHIEGTIDDSIPFRGARAT
jgi:hypothetical protein